ncbi:1,4-beta-xylanase [Pedobacter ginsengisoli]|uniref:Beta-xylanase n=1 Tax=Pedobacter ginsengisoli TaxID=363852 RepID=A0A2D1U769_9SPHI|nr:endo-1,4-beta-xylanase [Pedobacter ginsengisoli]ATP57430.1 1,4-beta-xylanase [Pedobacter ginsengisoli]
MNLLYKAITHTLFAIAVLLLPIYVFAQTSGDQRGLKDYYRDYFPMGVAVTAKQLADSAQQNFILTHFNSLTAENAMKMGPIHPKEDLFFWKDADAIVAFAQKHNLKVRGHNLCWHNQTPKWIFYDEFGKQVSKEVLLQRLKDHIYAVVGRYKGQIYAWDVVNEAVSDEPDQLLRNSLWYQICGEDFIYKAFQYAHEADPKAILFYNDYNTENPDKRQRIYKLLKKMRNKGVPVHAIGLQAHWTFKDPSQERLESTLKLFASLGLKIQITELDVSIYADGNLQDKTVIAPVSILTPEREQQQAEQYSMIFKVFRNYKKCISGVTFWNLSDKYSWLDNFPVRGRKNYPLLFDTQLKPKKAYWNVVKF